MGIDTCCACIVPLEICLKHNLCQDAILANVVEEDRWKHCSIAEILYANAETIGE